VIAASRDAMIVNTRAAIDARGAHAL